MRYLLISIVFIGFTFCLNAQSGEAYYNQARKFVSNQQFDAAITVINKACQEEEMNLDYRLYRVRINTWKRDFEMSLLEINYILQKNPHYKEAELLLLENYLAQKEWGKLDTLTATLLSSTRQVEDSVNILKRYAMGLMEQGRNNEAVKILSPVQHQVYPLWEEAKIKNTHKTIFAHYTQYQLNTGQPNWHIYELEYIHRLKKLTYSIALNRASRFNAVGNQGFIQLYPRITRRSYAWIIGGVSDAKTYPKYVYGASYFVFPIKNVELEVGIRSLKLTDNPRLNILRGGLVFDNALHRVGYNIAHVNNKTGAGFTHILFYQNYFKKDESYLRFGLAKGSNINNLLTAQFDNFIINSYVLNVSANYVFNRHWRVLMGFTHENYKNTTTETRNTRLVYDMGMMYKF